MKENILLFLTNIQTNLSSLLTIFKNFFKEFYLRLKAKTPPFLMKIRTLCLTLTGIGGTLVAANVNFTIWGMDVPKLVAVLGIVASIIASLGVTDPATINQQVKN